MKTLRVLIVVLGWLTSVSLAQAQSQTPESLFRQYIVKLRLTTQTKQEKGTLYELTDSTIVLAPIYSLMPTLQRIIEQSGGVLPPTDSLTRMLPLRTYRYADVRQIDLHRRGRGASGALIGAGLGTAVGFALGDDHVNGFLSFTANHKAFMGAIGGSGLGSLVGVSVGQQIDARKRAVSTEAPRRFRKYTLVDQLNQTMLYANQSQSPANRPWTIAVTLVGWQRFGPASALERTMNKTGWASTEAPYLCFFGCVTDYPYVQRRAIFDVDLGYRVSARRGYQFSVGRPHHAYVTGRKAITPNVAWLELHNRVWAASFRWAWFSRTGRWVGSAGPALLLFQTDHIPRYSNNPVLPRQRYVRPGLHLSGQYNLVNRRTWQLALKTDARLGWPAYQAYTITDPDAYPNGATYYLPETNVSAFSLNIGLQTGFKF